MPSTIEPSVTTMEETAANPLSRQRRLVAWLYFQNKLHASNKEMMLDLVLVTLISSQCLFPNSGVTYRNTFLLYFFFSRCDASIIIKLWHRNYNFYLHKVSILESTTEYTVEDSCISPLGRSLKKFFLSLPSVQPQITGRQIADPASKWEWEFSDFISSLLFFYGIQFPNVSSVYISLRMPGIMKLPTTQNVGSNFNLNFKFRYHRKYWSQEKVEYNLLVLW